MVTITNADNALKTFYLGVLADQLNVGVNPLLAKIGQTSADVWGKEIKKLAPYGINGGIGSGAENDDLPMSGGNNYAQFTLALKNLFGKIEISDKAVRASESSAGAFINLLNAEMDGLLKASKFNFGRMLYGNGSGLLATTVSNSASIAAMLTVDSIKNLVEGMTLDVYNSNESKNMQLSGARIVSIDRENKIVTLSVAATSVQGAGLKLYVQGSKGNEITGLEAIFGTTASIYGLNRADYSFLNPFKTTHATGVNVGAIQDAIDKVDEIAGGTIDFIVGSYKMRKQYVDCLSASRTNIDYLTLDGGYKALSYAGVPFIADRFVSDNDVYLLNSSDFKLHQLCDWRWLEGESGSVLHQVPGKACYSATLVKYADLLCERPMGQAKLTFTGVGNIPSDIATHTVTFNSGSNGSAVPSQTVIKGNAAVEPKAPASNDGGYFEHWCVGSSAGAEYNFTTAVNEDITLYALWS